MSLDNLQKLEDKINKLIEELKALRAEKQGLLEKNKQCEEKISILGKENREFAEKVSHISGSVEGDRKKMELAADKIRDLLGKLDNI